MKVFYDADLDERKFEGRTTLALKLKKFLAREGYEFTDDINKADLLHVHSSGIFPSKKAYQIKKKYGIPVIYSLYSTCETEPIRHITNAIQQRKHFGKTATNLLLSYSATIPLAWRSSYLRKLDKVVVPLQYLKNKIGKNTQVIRFGIDLEKFKPSKQPNNKKVKVAFLGHPGVFKGVNDFVLASKYFSKNIKPYMFLTKKTPSIARFVGTQGQRIELYGLVEDIHKVYAEMDIIVLPYRTSLGTVANPLVLLESMASGKCIITTNLPTIKEITQGAVEYVHPYKPKAIARAVNIIAQYPEQRKIMGLAARKIVEKNHDQKHIFNEYLKLYEEFA